MPSATQSPTARRLHSPMPADARERGEEEAMTKEETEAAIRYLASKKRVSVEEAERIWNVLAPEVREGYRQPSMPEPTFTLEEITERGVSNEGAFPMVGSLEIQRTARAIIYDLDIAVANYETYVPS